MGTHLQQETVLRATAVLPHIEVVTDVTKTAGQMVTPQLLHRIILIAPRSRTMQHKVLHGLGRHHKSSALHAGEEGPLIANRLPANRHWKLILSHRLILELRN